MNFWRFYKDSDFEENFSDGDIDLESEEDDGDVSGLYIVESPNHITTDISTASSSYDLPTGSPSRAIQPLNRQVWAPTDKNAPSIIFVGNTGMLKVPNLDEPIHFFCTHSRTIFLILLSRKQIGNVKF